MCPNNNDGSGAAPTVSGVSPTGGPGSGGTSVTLTGSGLSAATAVTFGAAPAASFTVGSDTELTAVSPAGSGTVDVTVTTPLGVSPTVPSDRFTYEADKDGKEHKDKEKEGKEHKELKEKEGKEHKEKEKEVKEVKEGKEHKDKEDKEAKEGKEREKPPEALFENRQSTGIHPSVPVDPTATHPDAGPVGRAFIAPPDRPAVGRKALNDETDDL